MSGGSGLDTRWPTPWRAAPAAARVPQPTAQAVAAAPLLAALLAALGDEPPPCAAQPEVWTSDHSDDVLVAREGCRSCPARRQCLAHGVAVTATAGTWGGRHHGASQDADTTTTRARTA